MSISNAAKTLLKKWSTSKPDQPIPYGRQTLGQAEIDAVIQVLQSDFITQGPAIDAFEKAVAEYCQVPYAVAFSSGTAALHAAYFAAGLGPGDEAITAPLTFVATANALLYQGAKPVFADIDPGSWNLDPVAVEAALTPQTKAIIPVHFAGQPANLERFYQLADHHDLIVIEDACHALGARYQDKPIGQCRDMAVFSTHPVKSITTGEGGIVVTPHAAYYEKLRRFRTHGITKSESEFLRPADGPWYYEMQELGYNYRLTDIQAAIGTVQIGKLDSFIDRRNQLATRYREAFSACSAIQMQQPLSDAQSAHHLFVIRLNPDAIPQDNPRRALYDHLVAANIRPQVHYLPVHLQPYYLHHEGTQPGTYPVAEGYYQHCLSLPIYPTLTDSEQEYVIERVLEFLQ